MRPGGDCITFFYSPYFFRHYFAVYHLARPEELQKASFINPHQPVTLVILYSLFAPRHEFIIHAEPEGGLMGVGKSHSLNRFSTAPFIR